MDARTVNSIAQQIHHQFPEVAGQRPNVRPQSGAKTPGRTTYLLTFKGQAKSGAPASGPQLARTVRVVVDESGRILKITTSR